MQVKASGIEAQLGKNSIDLVIYDTKARGGKLRGTLQIGMAQVVWRPPSTKKNFKGQSLEQFITDHLDRLPDLK